MSLGSKRGGPGGLVERLRYNADRFREEVLASEWTRDRELRDYGEHVATLKDVPLPHVPFRPMQILIPSSLTASLFANLPVAATLQDLGSSVEVGEDADAVDLALDETRRAAGLQTSFEVGRHVLVPRMGLTFPVGLGLVEVEPRKSITLEHEMSTPGRLVRLIVAPNHAPSFVVDDVLLDGRSMFATPETRVPASFFDTSAPFEESALRTPSCRRIEVLVTNISDLPKRFAAVLMIRTEDGLVVRRGGS